jgi:hypothetical protein
MIVEAVVFVCLGEINVHAFSIITSIKLAFVRMLTNAE